MLSNLPLFLGIHLTFQERAKLEWALFDITNIVFTILVIFFVISLGIAAYYANKAPKDMDLGDLFRTDDL